MIRARWKGHLPGLHNAAGRGRVSTNTLCLLCLVVQTWSKLGEPSWRASKAAAQLGEAGACMENLHMCQFPGWLSTAALPAGVCSPGLRFRMLLPCPLSWEGAGLYPPAALWSLEGQQDFPCLLFQLPFPMHSHTASQATASLCLSPSQTNLN